MKSRSSEELFSIEEEILKAKLGKLQTPKNDKMIILAQSFSFIFNYKKS